MKISVMGIEYNHLLSGKALAETLSHTNMCFIAEDITTESEENMERILNTAKMVGEYMNNHMFIIDRSEASQSRVGQIEETIQEELKKRNKNITFEVIANPNFLRA